MNTQTKSDAIPISADIHQVARNLGAELVAGARITEIGVQVVRFLESRFPYSDSDSSTDSLREREVAEECGELALFLSLESERLGFDFTKGMATELGDFIFGVMFPQDSGSLLHCRLIAYVIYLQYDKY